MKMKSVTVLASALVFFSLSTAAPASPVCSPLVVPSTVFFFTNAVDDDDLIFANGFEYCLPQSQSQTCNPGSGIPKCGIVKNNCGIPVNCDTGYCISTGGTCNAGLCECPSNDYLCGFRAYCESTGANINPCTKEIFLCNGCPPNPK